jgi:hypothetical protein
MTVTDIAALRKNYENVRFADHTNDPDPRKMMERMRSGKQQVRPAAKSPIPLAPLGFASSLRSVQQHVCAGYAALSGSGRRYGLAASEASLGEFVPGGGHPHRLQAA